MIVVSSKPVEFIPEAEKEKDKPVTFIVKPPTREVVLKLQDLLQENLMHAEDLTNPDLLMQSFKFSDYASLILDECVIGWKNVFTKDDNGNLVELPFSKENLKLITDLGIISELVSFIDSLAFLGK